MRTELQGVAAQYAEAALELASAAGGDTADAVGRDLLLINQLIEQDRQFATVLELPSVNAEEKKELLKKVLQGKVNDLTLKVLDLLADKRRLEILGPLEHQYREMLNKKNNLVSASLVSSEKLSDQAVANIKARLTEHLGKRLELEVKVDPSLIGGVVLRLGDQVIDGSLKGQLKAIEKALLAV